MLAPCLPGLEDVHTPPGPRGWDEALLRLERKPAKRSILLAFRKLAGGKPETRATNATLLATIVSLGFAPLSEDSLKAHLREMERVEGLIVRDGHKGAKSRRRIGFPFLDEGEGRPHPRVKVAHTLGCGSPTPKGEGRPHPSPAQVIAAQQPAPEPVSPLNSIPMQEEETLRTCAPERTEEPVPEAVPVPEPAAESLDDYWAKVRRHCEAKARARATEPPPAPTTVEVISRLAAPCGPEAVEAAARQIAARLGDEKSVGCYRGLCEAVRSGDLAAETLAGGFKAAWSAREAGLARPGGVLVGFVGAARKATPGSTRQCPPGAAPKHEPPSVVDPSVSNCTRRVAP